MLKRIRSWLLPAVLGAVLVTLLQTLVLIASAAVRTVPAMQSAETSSILAVIKELGVPTAIVVVVMLGFWTFAKRAGPAFSSFTAGIQAESAKMGQGMLDLYRERLEASEKRALDDAERSRQRDLEHQKAIQEQAAQFKAMLDRILEKTREAMDSQASKHGQEMAQVSTTLSAPIQELVGQVKTQTEVLRELSRDVQRRSIP